MFLNKSKKICYGCGICAGICPTGAITMKISKEGMYLPEIDKTKCTNCGLCDTVCPWKSFDYKKINKSVYNTDKIKDAQIGNYINCYLGHATDNKIRYNASSGGLVTSILLFALKEKIIDGAIITRMKKDNPFIPEPFIAKTKEELLSATGSKYISVSLDATIKKILESKGKYAVVGLPCHIQGLRKAELQNKELKKKIVLHLGLMCSGTISSYGTKLLTDTLDLNVKDTEEICYRGKGWPGGFKAKLKNKRVTTTIKFKDYFSIIRFHTLLPCLLCWDSINEFADISFGDAWLESIKKQKNIGTSIAVSKTLEGEKILERMKSKKIIKLHKIDSEKIIKSQSSSVNFKKGNLKLRLFLFKLFNKNSPNFKNVTQIKKSSFLTRFKTLFLFGRYYLMSKKTIRKIIDPLLIKYLKSKGKK